MKRTGIIFDMDGTLWDSAEEVARSWTRVVNSEYDTERIITTEEIQGVMGKRWTKLQSFSFRNWRSRTDSHFWSIAAETRTNIFVYTVGGCIRIWRKH